MKLRKPLAAAGIAGAVVLGVAACSDDDTSTGSDSSTTATSQTAVAESDSPAPSSGAEAGGTAVSELTEQSAQQILRTAVSDSTSADDLKKVVATTNPAAITTLQAFAKAANAAGYTPEVYTVSSVSVTGDKATAKVAVKSPHAPMPLDVDLTYAKVDGSWKLSSDAVNMLSSFAQQFGH